jgi:alpha-methylacyl-CoA racemase
VLPSSGPLTGVRVVELGGLGPGPYACMLLAEMGADVVRVDRPGGVPSSVPTHVEMLHRSRPNLAVDLKQPRGLELLLRLVDEADVLVEGLRPGVMERLGVGPDDCLARNPRLVYGRMTGWGQDGPLARTAGHDINYLGLTGVLHAIGPADRPVPPLNLAADFGGGAMFLVTGILAALLERVGSGHGQVVDAAMVDGAASLATMTYGWLAAGLWTDSREANMLDGGAPFYTVYRCADGRFMAVGAIEPQFYAAMLERLGLRPEDLPGSQHERQHWAEQRRILADRFAGRSRDDWAAVFDGTDACVTPVLSMAEAQAHPHMRARGTFLDWDGSPHPGQAPRFSRTPGVVRGSSRRVGQDSVEVLSAWGVSEAETTELLQSGVVIQAPVAEA